MGPRYTMQNVRSIRVLFYDLFTITNRIYFSCTLLKRPEENPLHILIVDDDDAVRRSLDRFLRSYDHTTCWSATGLGALSLLRSERVDVVILDINLGPGVMSGWDVAREKLLDPSIRGVPVIVLSGLTTQQIHHGARATTDALSGTTLLLNKPCDGETLVKALSLIQESR